MASLSRTSSQNRVGEKPSRSTIGAPAQIAEVTTAERAVTWKSGNIE